MDPNVQPHPYIVTENSCFIVKEDASRTYFIGQRIANRQNLIGGFNVPNYNIRFYVHTLRIILHVLSCRISINKSVKKKIYSKRVGMIFVLSACFAGRLYHVRTSKLGSN